MSVCEWMCCRDRIVWGPSKKRCHPNSWQLTIKDKENKTFLLSHYGIYHLSLFMGLGQGSSTSWGLWVQLSKMSGSGSGIPARQRWHHLALPPCCSCKLPKTPGMLQALLQGWGGLPARGPSPPQGIYPLQTAFGVTKNNVREHKNYPPQPVMYESVVMDQKRVTEINVTYRKNQYLSLTFHHTGWSRRPLQGD